MGFGLHPKRNGKPTCWKQTDELDSLCLERSQGRGWREEKQIWRRGLHPGYRWSCGWNQGSREGKMYENCISFITVSIIRAAVTKYNGCIKTTEIYYLTVLKARSWKLRCWQSHASSEASNRESFLDSSSFWHL